MDENGLVTAVRNGTSTITATSTDGSGITATCVVTVSIPVLATSIRFDRTEASLTSKDQGIILSAYFSPYNATNKELTWTSSDTSVATVDNGHITAVSNGTAIITATTQDGSNLTATCVVTVNLPVKATDISLNQTELSFTQIGQTAWLTATIEPENTTNPSVSWESSDENVVTVEGGMVTAVGEGEAWIYARTLDGTNLYASCYVEVHTQGTPACDLTGDGEVNGADIVTVINYVLEDDYTGDVNGDGEVNGADIVTVINYVLGYNEVKAMHHAQASHTQESEILLTAIPTPEGFDMNLQGGDAYTAFQFTLTLPLGCELKGIVPDKERLNGHQMLFHRQAEGEFLVLGYAMNNQCIQGASGLLLNLMTTEKQLGKALVSNIMFFTPQAETKKLNDIHLDLETNIKEIKNHQDSSIIYDLYGHRVNTAAMREGIYLRNGKKHVNTLSH